MAGKSSKALGEFAYVVKDLRKHGEERECCPRCYSSWVFSYTGELYGLMLFLTCEACGLTAYAAAPDPVDANKAWQELRELFFWGDCS